MATRNKMRFRTRLALLFLLTGLAPILLLGYLNFQQAYKILEQQAADQLIFLREDRKAQVQDFFINLRLNVEVLGDHRLLKDIMAYYIKAYHDGGLEGEAFKAVDAKYHQRLVELCDKYGFEDMLFADNEGNVVVTVKKIQDWGVNLISGVYHDTNLARCFRNALNGISIVDFEEYPPLGGPAAFIGAPMSRIEARKGFKAGEMYGVLIIRIPVDQINAITMRKDGLGETGETYLIGKDMLLRSDSRFLKKSALLKVRADAGAGWEVLEKGSGYKEKVIDYRDRTVSAAFESLEIKGLDWIIVAKMDQAEILKPIRILRNQCLIIGLLVGFGIVLADLLFVAGIIRPLRRMQEAADRIAAGDYNLRLPVETRGEIGRLAEHFNRMAESLLTSKEKIDAYGRTLEKRVILRTKVLHKQILALKERNRTQKAHNEIIVVLSTEIEIKSLLNKIVAKIAYHTDSQLGVLYVYESESQKLRPAASYAIDKEILGDGFGLGGGFPGQAALEKRVIFVENIPADYFRISSGGFEGLPKNAICIPITFKDRLMGVLELASLHDYTEKSLEFLNVAAYQIGIGINNALVYLRMERLAEDLKEKNDILAAQNEELQAQSEELQAQAEELMAQKMDIEEKTKKVEQADRLKSEFLSNMSHELRTPLNSLLGLTSLMAGGSAGPVSNKQKEYLEIIEKNGKNLLQLINDVLDLSRIEAGIDELSINRIQLQPFISSIVHATGLLIEEKGLTLNVDVG
ncbi:MAG: HAMP domain-containing protein, partial [Proteobacteria bacterium]|nr:HAMP domain-containing protein [Pseudomonadota bacterium]